MSAAARRVLRFAGVPAAEASTAAGMSIEELRRARRALGRDPDDGGPPTARRTVAEVDPEHERFDALMRSNRGVRGL